MVVAACTVGRGRRGEARLLLALLLLALVVSGHCLDAHHHGLKRRRKKHEIHSPIKTVVVVVMENRSFDHILGWLRRGRPDIDGLTGRESNHLNAFDPSSPEIFVTDEAGYVDSDPGHGFEDIREQIFGSAVPPPMSGFVPIQLTEQGRLVSSACRARQSRLQVWGGSRRCPRPQASSSR